ncbi:MAG: HIRAN domain-containing protein [Porticoccaceae bacterium]
MEAESEKAKRVSLTKSQRASQVGADLLALCQSVTNDGSLSEEEVAQIRAWLVEHKESDLPAIPFLIPIVEGILQDGVVTDTEKRDLFIAIERVLPQDVRAMSKAARLGLERADKEQERATKEQARLAQNEEKERNRPVARFDFMVAGTRYEGRSKIIERYVEEGDRVVLSRDHGNSHSENAIQVMTDGGDQIGFVPEDDAVELAPLLDSGHIYSASIKKLLSGSRSPIPVVVAAVYQLGASIPTRSTASTKSGAGPTFETAFAKGLLGIFVAIVALVILVRACSG